MNTKEITYQFKHRFNKLSSNKFTGLTPMQIDSFINDAQRLLIQETYQLGGNSRFMDLAAPLIVNPPDQPVIEPSSTTTRNDLTVYEFKMDDLKYDYFHLHRVVVGTKSCGKVQAVIESESRIEDILSDALSRPNKTWKRVVGVMGRDNNANTGVGNSSGLSLFLYSDTDLPIEDAQIYYVKYPRLFFSGGYDTLDYLQCRESQNNNCTQFYSSASDPVTLELATGYHSAVIDKAVMEACRVLGITPEYQLHEAKRSI